LSKKTETKKEHEGKVTVTLKLPEPLYHFFKAAAQSYNKSVEEMLIEELTQDAAMILDTADDPRKIIISAFGLKPYIGA
jgi:hypothetical protein